MSKVDTWECPICHNKLSRFDKFAEENINRHKRLHPDNQRAFTGAMKK